MKTSQTSKWAAFLALACCWGLLTVARAEVPNGNYQVIVTTDLEIWDVSGNYHESIEGLDMSFTLNLDGKGKLTGSGFASGWQQGVSIDLAFNYTGSVSASKGITKLTLKMKGVGTAEYGGTTYQVTFSSSGKFELDPVDLAFHGDTRAKICIKGEGCESGEVEFDMDLPAGMTGDYTLDATLSTDSRNRITGTGALELSSGRRFEFGVKGTYNAKRDDAKFTLTGLDKSGVKFSATGRTEAAMLQASKLSGKVLGQSISVK